MSAESLVVNPTLHPDNDELRLAPRWGGLIRQGSRQRVGVPGRGRGGLQRQGAGGRLGSSGWGWGWAPGDGALLWVATDRGGGGLVAGVWRFLLCTPPPRR